MSSIKNSSILKYSSPAKAWTQALPIGNGKLGAMIFGGEMEETICLNHDELWTGYPTDRTRRGAYHAYRRAQELALEGKLHEASKEIEENFEGGWSDAYLPLGKIEIAFKTKRRISSYLRTLDISNAVSNVSYTVSGKEYKREYFASYPDGMICSRFTFGDRTDFEIKLSSDLLSYCNIQEDKIFLYGECPGVCFSNNNENIEYSDKPKERGIRFCAGLKVITDGQIKEGNCSLLVNNASRAEIYFTAETSFNTPFKHPFTDGKEYKQPVIEKLNEEKNYSLLLKRHTDDYKTIYDRVELNLGGTGSDLDTDKRLEAFQNTKDDSGLVELLYNYGRYLIISSSRPGSQPANLQGIWNDKIKAPWHSNYTVNINTEMNYWPVLMCSMPEINLPLINMIKELSIAGRDTAENRYRSRGWCSHHNVDIWRLTTPVAGNPCWAFWHGSTGWFCRHIFEHYEYTGDIDYLKTTAYPIMKTATLFYLDNLIEYNGNLIFTPGTSPENGFIYEGKDCFVAKYSMMSISIAQDLFQNMIKAAEILDTDEQLVSQLKETISKLPGFKTGSFGQLLEFDDDYPEREINHRHVSHLYALHPANIITADGTPELANACRKTLERRGDNGTGWSLGWKINFWARLFDGNHALKLIEMQLRPVKSNVPHKVHCGGTYENLFDAHPPFQIDGNFGFVSGVTEMFMQSRDNKIYLLPALPDKWSSGSVKGLTAKGNVKVDITWENGKVTDYKLTGKGKYEVIVNGKSQTVEL
ncbi:MAG: glycoside hydrolase family 95 protein [Clostridiales bacterium]|nr:glycoside hydrolase family 95 protein [Clostridiales bacterium]